MWKMIPNSYYTSEPEVLRNLKQLLAKNTCDCKICNGREKQSPIQLKDKPIQVTDENIFNTIGKVTSSLQHDKSQHFQNNIFCPGCYIAMNLCRQKELKFLKDEESETKTEMFSRDKSTEKEMMAVEKSTSNTNMTKYKDAIVSLSENCFDDVTKSTTNDDNQKSRKDPTTLLDCQQETLETVHISSNCLCMTNFINSIRPPLLNSDIYDM